MKKQTNKNSLLKISGYLSIACILGILCFLEEEDWLGAVPFLINAIYSFRFIENKFNNKEAMIAYAVIMTLINIMPPVGFSDTALWIFFGVSWINAKN